MPIYLDSPATPSDRDLFGDTGKVAGSRKNRGRQMAVFCARCEQLDSIFWGGGKSVSSARCCKCGGELTTSRSRSAKLKLYDAIMKRCLGLVMAAAHGEGDIESAVTYAEYAAHTAFRMRLVPYGPEPRR